MVTFKRLFGADSGSRADMTYGIYFDSRTPAGALRQALHVAYDVPLELVYAGPHEKVNDHPGPDSIAVITPTGGPFGNEFSAGEKLQKLTKASPLELAQVICWTAHTRALLDDDSPAPDYWFLVASDGSHGRVQTDPISDDLTILYALEPIAGEPDLPVVPPPDWARTW